MLSSIKNNVLSGTFYFDVYSNLPGWHYFEIIFDPVCILFNFTYISIHQIKVVKYEFSSSSYYQKKNWLRTFLWEPEEGAPTFTPITKILNLSPKTRRKRQHDLLLNGLLYINKSQKSGQQGHKAKAQKYQHGGNIVKVTKNYKR